LFEFRVKFAKAFIDPPEVEAVNLILKLLSRERVVEGGIPDRIKPSSLIQEGKAVLSSFVAE